MTQRSVPPARTFAPRGEGGSEGSLEELLAQVRACTLCDDLPLGPRPILQASAQSRILIASQAPGRRAHERGVPFDDPSGDRLREWLGVDREAFYDPSKFAIVPMGFCFPGTGKGGDLPPRSECAPTWLEAILDQLPALELTLVVGQYALDWHLGNERPRRSVTERVEAWRDRWPSVLPLPHPSPRNQRWLRDHPWFEDDVLPVLRGRVAELLR